MDTETTLGMVMSTSRTTIGFKTSARKITSLSSMTASST
jgi:hypothetical protein